MADTATRALALWEHLADTRVRAPLTVAVSPNSRVCPPGWCGIVHLDGRTLATAPTEELADALHRSLASVEPAAHTEPEALTPLLPIGDILGPATLAYLSPPDFRPATDPRPTQLPADHPDLRALLDTTGPEDAGESGLGEITSPAHTIYDEPAPGVAPRVIAAAGYRHWPSDTAHLCVLTAPEHRGQGLARPVASASAARALAENLLPQWRARLAASRRVALGLGFRELASQLSLRLA